MVRLVTLRLLESYFRHRWLYMLPIVVMLLAGIATLFLLPPNYKADATMYVQGESLLSTLTVDVNDGFGYMTAAQATSNDINELIQTDFFARSSISLTDAEPLMAQGPKQVETVIDWYRQSITVVALGENLVSISAEAEEPVMAQQLVNATIDTFLKWKISNDQQDSIVAEKFFDDLTKPYEQQLATAQQALQDYLAKNPDPQRGERPTQQVAQIGQLQATVDAASERLRQAQENKENSRLALTKAESDIRQTYSVVDLPTEPSVPEMSLRTIVQTVGIFLAVGGILSAAGIAAGVLLDRTLRFPLDVRHLGKPMLMAVPQVPKQSLAPINQSATSESNESGMSPSQTELRAGNAPTT